MSYTHKHPFLFLREKLYGQQRTKFDPTNTNTQDLSYLPEKHYNLS